MKKKLNGDVEWYFKNKRPIAYSTKAVSDTLVYFKNKAKSWEELKEMLPYGFDEKLIIDKYMSLGAKFEEIIWK